MLTSARGRVLEIGSGDDTNRRYYRGITDLRTIKWRELVSTKLAVRGYDTIVCDTVLCSVDDVYSTLLRVAELLARGGQVLVLEHVRATGFRARVQDRVASLGRRCRPNRDIVDHFRQAGFAVIECDRFNVGGRASVRSPAISAIAISRVREDEGVVVQ